MMNVNVFDTYVHMQDGRRLHFDVLIEGKDQQRAAKYARDWITERGLHDAEVEQSLCLFCHSEPANPVVAAAINERGYFVIPLLGC